MLTTANEIIHTLPGISLAELDSVAALRTRTDRKYVVGLAVITNLVEAFADEIRVLDIAGGRSAAYESVYFDTADLDLYLAAAYRRRRRFKVRTRTYPSHPHAVLEVKQKSGRGETIKQRHHDRVVDPRQLSEPDRRFIDQTVGQPGASRHLIPTLTTFYKRTTLLDAEAGTRLTYDEDLRCVDWRDHSVSLAKVVVETKTAATPSVFDRWLWAQGHRPERISKYCVGLAVLHPHLPSNKWRRTIKRHFVDHPNPMR